MEKLKPCPCGTVKPRWARHSQWGDHWEGITMYRIDCSDCDATTGWHEGRNEAVDVWNTQCTMHSRQSAIIAAQAEIIEAMQELMDARDAEIQAAVRHDDYHIGGKVRTEGQLKAAKERVLKACERGAAARAKLEALNENA